MRRDQTKIVQNNANSFVRPSYGQVYRDARNFRSQIMAQFGRRLTRGLRKANTAQRSG